VHPLRYFYNLLAANYAATGFGSLCLFENFLKIRILFIGQYYFFLFRIHSPAFASSSAVTANGGMPG